MNNKLLFTFLLVFFAATLAFSQTGSIKGTVMEKGTETALEGANVFLKGTTMGASSHTNGEFEISDVPTGRYELTISYIGYATYTTIINVTDGEQTIVNTSLSHSDFMGESVVVTASRRAQKITEAPATINVISAQRVSNYAGNPGELLAYEKGVDFVRTGVQGTGINIRGFNSAFNPKNLQMNDSRLSTLIATGLPLGSFATTTKDDIERVEIILGPNAALYGPNAHNGLVNTITKDPRTSEGTTVAAGGGNQSTIGGRIRHAKVVNDFFRYKVTAEYAQGEEFGFVDSVYIGGVAFDELNLDPDFDSMRGEANFYFSPNSESDLILTYGGSNSNNLGVTNAGRNQIKDWQIHFLQAQYVSPRFFAQVYHTWSKTEDTYAINQRTQNYWSFINAGFSEAEALERSLHELWFAPFGIALNRESNFKDNSKRLNAEAQYNNTWSGFDVTVGAQFQRDMADSKGTYLLDEGGIDINQVGAYAQIETELGESGFELIAAARLDDHDLYGSNFIPKGGLLYKTGSNNFRLTYGKGIAAPSILNLSGNIFGGLLIGNGEGFTLADGTEITKLEVETIQTIEAGYKGILNEKFYLDVNGYYNLHENFISPLINIAATSPVVARGGVAMSEVIPGTAETGSPFLLTYLNFGEVNTFGFDLGMNYFYSPELTLRLNYSYFDFDIDKDDPKNDGNLNGVVDENDLPINTPKHKINFNALYSKNKIFGGLGVRWVDEYDFFSGINIAASTNEDLIYGGSPVVEGQRVGRDFNEGPLGGYVNFDLSLGYKLTPNASVAAQVTNIFDSEVREFVASPEIGRLVSLELKYTFY